MLPILECARCSEIINYAEVDVPGYKNCKCGALQTTLTAAGYVTISVDPSEYKISWPEEEE